MVVKLFQLNIEEGRFQDRIYDYVKQHDFDILHFQEVTSGQHNIHNVENMVEIKKALGYEGEQSIYWRLKDDSETYMSNGTFFKPSLQPVAVHEVFLKPYQLLTLEKMRDYASHATSLLDVVFNVDGTNLHCINTHLVWGPNPKDEPYKLEQGKVLVEYIQSLTEPFILSGDFNVTPDSQIVRWLDELGVNQTTKLGVQNTLNPHTHRANHLFPKGLAVDFLYTSKDLEVLDFQLVDTPDLSDHFGLSVEISI